jgi:hypothetical protein
MRARLCPLLVAAILVAGCGGDDGGGGNGDSGNGGTSADQAASQLRENCMQSVEAAQGISDEVKQDLRDECDKIRSVDEAEARRVSQNVCARIVEETIPEGPARDAGVQACKQANR